MKISDRRTDPELTLAAEPWRERDLRGLPRDVGAHPFRPLDFILRSVGATERS